MELMNSIAYLINWTYKFLFISSLLAVPSLVLAQIPLDSIPVNDTFPDREIPIFIGDSIQSADIYIQQDSEVKKGNYIERKYNRFVDQYPKPITAAYFGLFFPGGGQLYNKDFWKVPIVWGAYAGIGYTIIQNTKNYRLYKNAVLMRLNNEADPFPQYQIEGLRFQRDFYRKNVERGYIGLIAVHALSALEAYVACHLKSFDISDDLSLNLLPTHENSFVDQSGSTSLVSIRWSLK
jgi:hypothetical protein